jgi:hypothetical protein
MLPYLPVTQGQVQSYETSYFSLLKLYVWQQTTKPKVLGKKTFNFRKNAGESKAIHLRDS